jgi:histidine triad (HIT) family protein
MIELPQQYPCEFCEGMAGRDERWTVVAESDLTLTVVNPYQFETGQCCVITRRHVGTLLDLTRAEGDAVIVAAREVARALLAVFEPLGILTFQNNGVYSGQEVPHYHFHVVPRQRGSDWGIGPPQLQRFPSAGRRAGTPHDASADAARIERAQVPVGTLRETARRIRDGIARSAGAAR